VKRTHGDLDQE